MKRQLTLRARVAIACGLIGLSLSMCFAAVTTWIAEDYEHILIGAMLAGQAQSWQDRLRRDPDAILPVSDAFAVYREMQAPVRFRGLSNGIHEFEDDADSGIHAGAFGEPGQRVVIVIEVGEIEELEDYVDWLMFVIVVVGTMLASWLGWVLAKRATSPVSTLAQAVGALPMRPVPTAFADEHGADEIGRLAGAIDGYQQRLVDVDAAERRFYADASHELRTPIAIIQGASEVMRDGGDLGVDQTTRLSRIDRALLELSSLLEALLLSARSLPDEYDEFDLLTAIHSAKVRIAAVDTGWGRRLHVVAGVGSVPVRAPRRWVDGIIVVLLQRLLAQSPHAHWEIGLQPGLMTVTQPGATGLAHGERILRSDLGIKLIFVERLCRNLGWQLEQFAGEHGQLSVRVLIPDDPLLSVLVPE